ncbi:DMT family transporter [Pseudodonghicola flavimaris]|uniref:DMT family transporter n=1 Tax=Pseudodonghicola flavimaris TaxID=3050036 RepID=A0ABT7EVM5_9RHOB|nr:DMT family transporter [Pseudodonghicola flavimaris]MDK3016368.1 DMT family transporter [Pseudodonghicola flavimaris]
MDNLRGAALMTVAMLGFAAEDMLIKLLAGSLPSWEIILILGTGISLVFALLTRAAGRPLWTRAYLTRPVMIRNLGEICGTVGMVTALALAPLAAVSAILQASPLLVTLGAALFLKEPVGWRRWGAVIVGFLGVMLVIQPGGAGFDPMALFALLAVVGLGMRDVATRVVPRETTSAQLSFLAFVIQIPTALVLRMVTGEPMVMPGPTEGLRFLGVIALGAGAYYALTAAMRVGEVSFVTPFRYTRIIFALVFALAVFNERPNALMLVGTAVIVASGIYTLWRERKHRPKP